MSRPSHVHVTFASYTVFMTSDYKSYLIRLQRENGQKQWRATLIDALSGEKQHFASDRALLIHLMQTLARKSLHTEESEEERRRGAKLGSVDIYK